MATRRFPLTVEAGAAGPLGASDSRRGAAQWRLYESMATLVMAPTNLIRHVSSIWCVFKISIWTIWYCIANGSCFP